MSEDLHRLTNADKAPAEPQPPLYALYFSSPEDAQRAATILASGPQPDALPEAITQEVEIPRWIVERIEQRAFTRGRNSGLDDAATLCNKYYLEEGGKLADLILTLKDEPPALSCACGGEIDVNGHCVLCRAKPPEPRAEPTLRATSASKDGDAT